MLLGRRHETNKAFERLYVRRKVKPFFAIRRDNTAASCFVRPRSTRLLGLRLLQAAALSDNNDSSDAATTPTSTNSVGHVRI